jgi:hypothetical protein
MTAPAPRPPLDVPQMWLMVAVIARNLAAMGFVAKQPKP